MSPQGAAGVPHRGDAEAAVLLREAALQAGGEERAKVGASRPRIPFIL